MSHSRYADSIEKTSIFVYEYTHFYTWSQAIVPMLHVIFAAFVGKPFMTLLGKGIRTREAHPWARNNEWLPSIFAHFPCDHFMQERYGREAIHNSVPQ